MKLKLDFAPRTPDKSARRLSLAGLMLTLLLGIVWGITSNTEAGPPREHSTTPADEEIAAINQAVGELNFPWADLLAQVEASIDSQARLLQIEVNAGEGRLTLRGEASDSRAVLALPGRLRTGAPISDARILSQIPVDSSEPGAYPIRFTLEATLGTGGATP